VSDHRPIGVFDSGLGGLTVVKALRKLLPNESIIYFGDTARVPYGNKSKELIVEYSKEITDFLIKRGAKMIVVACNTASAMALNSLKKNISIPVLGVINPGAIEAIGATQNDHIGIIGTVATITSGAYVDAIHQIDHKIKTSIQACPLLVPLAEEGWLDGDVVEKIVAHYLEPFQESGIDTLILGCTHYPLLKNVIADQLINQTVLIDSAEADARMVQKELADTDTFNPSIRAGILKCFVTDIPMRFKTVGNRFLGSSLDQVQTVHEF